MAKAPIVVKTRADAATVGFFQGNREQLIAKELRAQGIPAVGHHRTGITVEHGTLDVACEDGTGLHVFTWTPGEEPKHEEEQQQPAVANLEKLTKAQLVQYAADKYKLELSESATKAELIDAIEAQQTSEAA